MPLIISGPGIKGGTVSHEPVTGCDLFPTACEWAEVSPLGKIEGTSLVSLLSGSGQFRRSEDALLFHYPHYGQGPRQKPQSALILGNWKLIRDLETGKVQLFDLENDLSEKNDLSGTLPEKASEFSDLLTRRSEKAGAQMPTKNSSYDPGAEPAPRRIRPDRRKQGD